MTTVVRLYFCPNPRISSVGASDMFWYLLTQLGNQGTPPGDNLVSVVVRFPGLCFILEALLYLGYR